MENKIVLLACEDASTNMVYHMLEKFSSDITVIVEDRESLRVYLRRRIRRFGLFRVAGQLLFQVCIAKPLHWISRKRIKEIIAAHQLDDSPIPTEKIMRVSSVNAPAAVEKLQAAAPALVLVNGTRIISKKVLRSVNCRFINMHAGITPKYRGVHGAYWALAGNDPAHCGVTIHYVDEGIDTGAVLAQDIIRITKADNFATYPYLQLAAGLALYQQVLTNYFAGQLTEKQVALESKLYYHPTLWQYLRYRITRNVK